MYQNPLTVVPCRIHGRLIIQFVMCHMLHIKDQEANNKELKGKTYKKASLSTILINFNVTKLNFAIEITNKN